ncbi:hypothetical protein PspLS_02821 [Pyricularia sp. CBS 133598]|nr:hypothetical protein PspLS_02821 [Pyricularia sp. CBS 133598]
MATVTFTVTEFDLSNCRPKPIAERINDVPGLKTSTAFFSFLRANLVQTPSTMSSVNTPLVEPTDTAAGPHNLRRSGAAAVSPAALDDDDAIPPLSLELLTERVDRVQALKLVADSVAQQRQRAAYSLIFHPLPLALLAAGLALAYKQASHDLGTLLALSSGVVMTYLLAIRYITAPYIRHAEEMGWPFLSRLGDPEADGTDLATEDMVIGTKFGDELIGALVLRLEPLSRPGSSEGGKRRNRTLSLKGGRGVIRAWTTKLRFRSKGVGGDMLHEAVRLTRERCGRDAEVGFALEHANSLRVLPDLFNGPFRRDEVRASKALNAVLGEWEGARRKR